MLGVKRFKSDIDMCARPLFGKIIHFALPLILTGVLQLLYNATDIIVVGHFEGNQAMAAVGSTGSLVNLITNLFIGLSVGALASTARFIGAKNKERVDGIVHTSITISLIGGVILAIFGFFMAENLLKLMQTPDNVIGLSSLYLKIFFIGMPANLLYNFGASVLRACGDTTRPLIFLMISGVVNVGLNLTFVIVFKMGVAGVALATIIAQTISATLVIICLMRRKGYGKLSLKRLRINAKALADILIIGLPAGVQSTIFSLSNVIIQSSINSMGDLAMAGNAAAANLEGFVYVSMNAIAQASLAFTGQNFGAGKKKNIHLVLFQTTTLVTLVGLVLGVAMYLGGGVLLKLYNTDPNVISFGIERLSIISTTYFICGVMEVLVGSLRGIGKSIIPMIVSVLGVCGIRIVWIFTIFKANPTPTMLYLAYPVSWLFTAGIHFISFMVVKKKAFSIFKSYEKTIDTNIDNPVENTIE